MTNADVPYRFRCTGETWLEWLHLLFWRPDDDECGCEDSKSHG
jgi:hypothetical protein